MLFHPHATCEQREKRDQLCDAHWHIDVSYLNVCSTFYYLCTILNGYSRYMVHWEIREAMTVTDGETILQRALEAFLEARSRIISDNGPQVVARDFRAFIRMCGMMHVRTSPHYPRSNGKIERWYKTLRQDCIRPKTPLSMKDVHRTAAHFVKEYNELRSHSGIGYITPKDHLERQEQQIQAARRNNVQAVRAGRSAARHREEVGSASTCATSASPGIILIASAEIR